MGHKIELEDSDVQIIVALCDLALKQGGLANQGAVMRILSLLPQPEEKPQEGKNE